MKVVLCDFPLLPALLLAAAQAIRKRVAEDAREPLVEIVLVRGLFDLPDPGGGLAGHELGGAQLAETQELLLQNGDERVTTHILTH